MSGTGLLPDCSSFFVPRLTCHVCLLRCHRTYLPIVCISTSRRTDFDIERPILTVQCSAVQYSIERTFFYVGEDEVGSRYVPGFGGIADFGRGVEF